MQPLFCASPDVVPIFYTRHLHWGSPVDTVLLLRAQYLFLLGLCLTSGLGCVFRFLPQWWKRSQFLLLNYVNFCFMNFDSVSNLKVSVFQGSAHFHPFAFLTMTDGIRCIFTTRTHVLYLTCCSPTWLYWISEVFSNILKPLPNGLEGLYSIYIPLVFKKNSNIMVEKSGRHHLN